MKRITQADIDQLAQRHGFEDFQDLGVESRTIIRPPMEQMRV